MTKNIFQTSVFDGLKDAHYLVTIKIRCMKHKVPKERMVYIKRYCSMMKEQLILAIHCNKEEIWHLILDTNKQTLDYGL